MRVQHRVQIESHQVLIRLHAPLRPHFRREADEWRVFAISATFPDGERTINFEVAGGEEKVDPLLAMVGRRVEVHLLDAGDQPHLIAMFGGTLQAAHSLTGGDPQEQEAIFVRLSSGEEAASINLNRELFAGGMLHPDGGITVHFGSVDLMINLRAG